MKVVYRMVGIILGVIVGLYLLILLFIYAMQDKMLFYPTMTIETTPAESGLEYTDVYFTTEDGVKLNGWYIPCENPTATLIFCHGNGGNISHRMASINQFHSLNLSVFIFDYRGYGRSEGTISEDGTYKDAAAAWTYVTEALGVPPGKIIVFGRSLGGGIASWLAVNRPAAALILESTFTTISDIAAVHYPFIPVKWLAKYEYDSQERVSQLTIPKLFIHSPDDELVPYQLGEQLYQSAAEPKTFLKLIGSHNEGFTQSHTAYMKGVGEFISSVFPDTTSNQ
ncbi:MAG: alpha/beta hydrolase [Candidatus Zixiibacteriota bacterium]